jgi:hypothetical protein
MTSVFRRPLTDARAVSYAHAPTQRSAVITALGDGIVAAIRQAIEHCEGEPLPLHGITRRRRAGR